MMKQMTLRTTVLLAAALLAAVLIAGCGDTGGQPAAPTPTPQMPSTPEPTPTQEGAPTTMPPLDETPTPSGTATISGLAGVESIEVRILESMPVQVQVAVQGYLQDACTELAGIEQSRDGNTFTVQIKTTRPGEAACAEVIKPFEETIPLDVIGLQAGTYIVDVNGVTDTFELAVDNVAP